jgi:hypothetical protein
MPLDQQKTLFHYLYELDGEIKLAMVFPSFLCDTALKWIPYLKCLKSTYNRLKIYLIPLCCSEYELLQELRGFGIVSSDQLVDSELRRALFPVFIDRLHRCSFLSGVSAQEVTLLLLNQQGQILNRLSGLFDLNRGVALAKTTRAFHQQMQFTKSWIQVNHDWT